MPLPKPERMPPDAGPEPRWLERRLLPLLCSVVATCLLFFFVQTRHWPLVGDAAFVHYAVFLWDHGMVPYQQIVDVQMPGTLMLDWAVIHGLGPAAGGERVFDFLMILGVIASMLAITWPQAGARHSLADPVRQAGHDTRYVGFLAGGVFALLHARDGLMQAGQRDLTMAFLLLAAYALVFHAIRSDRAWLFAAGAFSVSAAATFKPTIVPAAIILFVLAGLELRRLHRALAAYAWWAGVGSIVPAASVLLLLVKEQNLGSFLHALGSVFPFYASLERRPVGYLLLHSFSPLMPMLCGWIVIGILRAALSVSNKAGSSTIEQMPAPARADASWEDRALYFGVALTLLSYVAQGKGFSYHRYPFLAFLLLVMLLHFQRACLFFTISASRLATRTIQGLGVAGLCFAALFLAPVSSYQFSRFDWRNNSYTLDMTADLERFGGSRLNGSIQCLDAFAGCTGVLYRMGLVASTGFLTDFYLLAAPPIPTIEEMREQFWNSIQKNPPSVFVVTEQVFPKTASSPRGYDKLKGWPAFDAYLSQHYRLALQRDPGARLWAGHADYPGSYRIYVRNP